MKFFTADKIREADTYTIANEPIVSVDLMERAAGKLATWITERTGKERSIKIFAGPGNNGGDGWALARLLYKGGYNVSIYLLKISDKLSTDSEINRNRLEKETTVDITELTSNKDFPKIKESDVLIDALFGSGLSRPLEGLAAELVNNLNSVQKAALISVDIPSGLFTEENDHSGSPIIHANFTLTFQFPKLSFFFSENEQFIGNFVVLDIGLHKDFIENESTFFNTVTEQDVSARIVKRKKFSHKGTYGHGLLLAGSYGMMGAAVLASHAAVRAGAGLITVHVPRLGVEIIQNSVPECLLSIDESDILISEHPSLGGYSAVAAGPGINQKSNTRKAILSLLHDTGVPLVLDADALNILSRQENWEDLLPEDCILTPHPGEFKRLFGNFDSGYQRMKAQQEFSKQYKVVVVLKGAHTCISLPDGQLWFNTTGNPGMATGGCGDVLTGIILGLLSQGYPAAAAAIIGTFIHGLAGDMGKASMGEHGLIASDLVDYIGPAFKQIENLKNENF